MTTISTLPRPSGAVPNGVYGAFLGDRAIRTPENGLDSIQRCLPSVASAKHSHTAFLGGEVQEALVWEIPVTTTERGASLRGAMTEGALVDQSWEFAAEQKAAWPPSLSPPPPCPPLPSTLSHSSPKPTPSPRVSSFGFADPEGSTC